jgi:hypothetical protein
VKTCPKRSYSVIENERFGLVFAKTLSIISGTGVSCGYKAEVSYRYRYIGKTECKVIQASVIYRYKYVYTGRGHYSRVQIHRQAVSTDTGT